jgi:hypothetical protein
MRLLSIYPDMRTLREITENAETSAHPGAVRQISGKALSLTCSGGQQKTFPRSTSLPFDDVVWAGLKVGTADKIIKSGAHNPAGAACEVRSSRRALWA